LTPYLKGSGRSEIKEASEVLQEQIENSQEKAEMIFMLAILAGRKYNTVGFKLLSPLVIAMNIETLRDDPTAKDLFIGCIRMKSQQLEARESKKPLKILYVASMACIAGANGRSFWRKCSRFSRTS